MSGLNHGWDKDEVNHADFVHGGVDPDDFFKEVNYHPHAKKNKTHKKPGCPGNDGGKHVYVWIPDTTMNRFWTDRKYEMCVCCGCGKQKPARSYRRVF